jgi:hypothetical protein
MMDIPHDAADLMLAPVVLALNARLEKLSTMRLDELAKDIALTSNVPDWTRGLREEGLVRTVADGVDCHGWELSVEPRGLCISHARREIVLGLPVQCRAYLDGEHRAVHVS